ncbi:hypothetical protein EBZ37_08445, partial [bacterium]|nr:hypothetical protein [bacterium]
LRTQSGVCIFLFDAWNGDSNQGIVSPNVSLIKTLEAGGAKNLVDVTNCYLESTENAFPRFNSKGVASRILESRARGERVILIGYSEGCLGLLQVLVDLAFVCSLEFLSAHLIDPPSEDLFDRKKSPRFWFVGFVAEWVQKAAGISEATLLADRSFPRLSDAFLWCFCQFWKYFLVPAANYRGSFRPGHADKFFRAVFAKTRALQVKQEILELDALTQQKIRFVTTVYLQCWRDEGWDLFRRIGTVKMLDLPHCRIRDEALKETWTRERNK